MTTFVVRIHSSNSSNHNETDLRGIVDEVASGARAKFRDTAELMAILRRAGEAEPSLPWSEQ